MTLQVIITKICRSLAPKTFDYTFIICKEGIGYIQSMNYTWAIEMIVPPCPSAVHSKLYCQIPHAYALQSPYLLALGCLGFLRTKFYQVSFLCLKIL